MKKKSLILKKLRTRREENSSKAAKEGIIDVEKLDQEKEKKPRKHMKKKS